MMSWPLCFTLSIPFWIFFPVASTAAREKQYKN